MAEDHDYISTACQHELHDRCRKVCKFCDEACSCSCHREENTVTEVLVLVQVRKQWWLDSELPWMIICPGEECWSPAEGINATVGWPDQETAMRVAHRHALSHSLPLATLPSGKVIYGGKVRYDLPDFENEVERERVNSRNDAWVRFLNFFRN